MNNFVYNMFSVGPELEIRWNDVLQPGNAKKNCFIVINTPNKLKISENTHLQP